MCVYLKLCIIICCIYESFPLSIDNIIVQLVVETTSLLGSADDSLALGLGGDQSLLGLKVVKRATLSFVDLAGSEKWRSHFGGSGLADLMNNNGNSSGSGSGSGSGGGNNNSGSSNANSSAGDLALSSSGTFSNLNATGHFDNNTNNNTSNNNNNDNNNNNNNNSSSYGNSAAASNASIQEMTHINGSLSTLGLCLAALVQNQQAIAQLKSQKSNSAPLVHVPYRSSTLTRVLRGCLGGDCKILLLATIYGNNAGFAGNNYNREETLQTLLFASRLKSLKGNVVNTYNG